MFRGIGRGLVASLKGCMHQAEVGNVVHVALPFAGPVLRGRIAAFDTGMRRTKDKGCGRSGFLPTAGPRSPFGLQVAVAAQWADGALAFDATDREVVANMEVEL